MKKIVHVITGLQQAGAETLLFRLVSSDVENKHIIVSLTSMGYYGEVLSKAGFEVHEINFTIGRLLGSSYKLFKVLSKHHTAVVHCWMYHANFIGGIAAKFAGVNNVIWSVHHLDSKCLKGTAKIFSRLSAILSRHLPNSIIYVSEESRDFHVSDGYFAKNSIVVHNFVDINVYFFSDIRRFEFRKKYNIPNDAFVFGSVARWHPIKGHVTLINAFSLLVQEFPLRDYRLVLVGPGINNHNVELVQFLKEAKLISKVVLIDAHSQLENVYPGLDVHVLASRKEAFGMATLEAIACGITTISTDVGFARKFTSDYKLLFPVDNHHDLFVCMRYASDKENVQERVDFALSDFTLLKAKAKYNNIWAHY